MRLTKLILADIRLQWKSGFYTAYAVFSAVYITALFSVPISARNTLATIMIFTDPSAMGLFFMGALILLEKSQGVNFALNVSPITMWEYCVAKLVSITFISLIVALILAYSGNITSILSCLTGVLLSSALFSACGLMVAEKAKTLNQFVLLAVPFELLICVVPAILLFGIDSFYFIIHPGVAAVKLISGDTQSPILCVLVLLAWCVPTFLFCVKSVKKHFLQTPGAGI